MCSRRIRRSIRSPGTAATAPLGTINAAPGSQPGQRRQMQMVGVQMGDQHHLGDGGPGRRHLAPAAAQMREAPYEQGSVSTRTPESSIVQVA